MVDLNGPESGRGPGHARRRRQRAALSAGVTVIVLATGGVVVFSQLDRTPPATVVPSLNRMTSPVRRTDLVEHIAVIGSVGYGHTSPLVGRRPGTVTWLPRPGTVIDRGGRIYAADAVPVPLLFGDSPMYRELASGVPAGEDVAILKRNLAALGYSVGSQDGVFRASTAAALKRWQKDLGAPQTGRLSPGDVVVLPGAIRVDAVEAQLAGSATGTILTITGTTRVVSASLEESQRSFAKLDSKVNVDLPGTGPATGTVRAVESVSGEGGGQPKLQVTIALDDPKLAEQAEAGSVRIRFSGASRKGVLAVPVQALLALREGGYAVEVVQDGGNRLLAVELGMFADGLVEINGPELSEGMQVVMAA
ncbi:peptidoglycan-binding protein [Allorhizocola rhizosphaerae]|uniref:peptidoglycan-binding protein n=1 Tax=Allorhizocola rhizosphaerae TaxID=1872709 RepID=UPI000E3BA77A|nr:peptidoglycan-binding protein [Allorhizocola rhizosphaerae]